jgi:hypothetical protein
MKNFKRTVLYLFLVTLVGCGKNEDDKEGVKVSSAANVLEKKAHSPGIKDTVPTVFLDTLLMGLTKGNKKAVLNSADPAEPTVVLTPAEKKADAVIHSPLKNLLNNAHIGQSYSQKELIEDYKFPKEAVALVKQVTYVGPNKLYLRWGNTWFAERVSDAKFKNDTVTFIFKQNKTYIYGGAIGIKHNKKIHTELILNNGAAYIPNVKGYHWDIGK